MKVNVKIEKRVKTEFTEEEMNALKLISRIECVGVDCCDCPFNKRVAGSQMCLSDEMKIIYEEVINNESNN